MKDALRRYLLNDFFTSRGVRYGLILGAVYLALLLTQLFTFESFPAVVRTWALPGGEITASLLTIAIPLMEAASLPYLISMKVQRRALLVSRGATIAAAAVWVVISLWLVMRMVVAESGLFGATISLPAGVWMLGYTALLLASALVVVGEKNKQSA